MTENMKKFTEAIEKDEALSGRMHSLETVEDLLALAKETGCELTEEDLMSLPVETGELSDEALDDVAGGGPIPLVFRGGKVGARTLVYRGGELRYSRLGDLFTKSGSAQTDQTIGQTTRLIWTKM